jgi:glycerate kinase
MQILIAPDSFKGSLSAKEVCTTIQKALSEVISNVQIEAVPMADGGEGTIDCLVYSTKGTKVQIETTGPLMDRLSSCYGILGDGKTAVIETAAIAGLTMVPVEKRNPLNTTTYGMGEIILHALNEGYRKFIIGLGGSATNDGGIGMLQALGAKFSDQHGMTFSPIGGSLPKITRSENLRK